MIINIFSKYTLIIFLFAIFLPKSIWGQSSKYFTTCYDGDAMGTSRYNYGVNQLPSGEMVFANLRGLVTFNGKNWKMYISKDAKKRPVPLMKLLPVGDQIYAGGMTDIGVWKKKRNTYEYQSFAVGKYKDKQFSTNMQVYQYKGWVFFVSTPEVIVTNGKKIIKIIKAPKKTTLFYLHKYQDKLLLSTTKSLLRWDEKSMDFSTIVEDKKTRVLVTEWQGKKLEVFLKGRIMLDEKDLDTDQQILGKRISKAQLYDQNTLLLGNRHNLYLLDLPTLKLQKVYTSKISFYQAFIDQQGDIWVAGNTNCHIELKSPFRNLITNSSIYSLKVNEDGVFAPSRNREVLHWLKQGYLVNIPLGANAYYLYDVGNQTFLVGTSNGIVLVNYKTKKVTKALKISTYSSIAYVKKTKRLYISVHRGIYVYRFDGQQLIKEATIKGGSKAFSLLVEENNIWVGFSTSGLQRLTVDAAFNVTAKKSFPLKSPNNNLCKVREKDGVIWANNPGGVFKFNRQTDKFEKIKVDSSGINREVALTYAVVDKDKLFFTGQSNRHTAIGMAPKQGDTYKIYDTPFKILPPYEISELLTHKGKLYIATSKGLISFDPSYQRKFDFHFPPKIVSKQLNLERQYQNNTANFQFFAPYFEAPEKTSFSYRLIGFDQKWSDWDKDTKKEYTNLPEGNYKFQVKAKNVYDVESTVANYTFTILPPWYRTWWAYALYILAGLALLIGGSYGYSRYRSRQLYKRNQLLEQEVAERTEEILAQKEEITQQADMLKTSNDDLKKANEKLQQVNQIIKAESDKKVGIYAQEVTDAMIKLEQVREVFNSSGAETAKRMLNVELNTTGKLAAIREKVSEAFPEFVVELDKALTSKQINKTIWQVAHCLKLGMKPKEIAEILPVQARSVSTFGSKLRKLGLLTKEG